MLKLRAGHMLLLLALAGMLAGAVYFAYKGLVVGDRPVPVGFYIAMGLGVFFSLIVGIGLMSLVFYSSRRGFDEPPSVSPDSRDPQKSRCRPHSEVPATRRSISEK